VRIEKVCCLRARRGLSCEECKTEHQIGVPLSGVNVRHVGGEQFAITPSHITLSNRGEEYRVSHPHGSGETQLTITVRENLLLELLGKQGASAADRAQPFAERQLPIAAKSRLALQLLMTAAKSQSHTALELEEAIVAVIARLLSVARTTETQTISSREGQLARAARSLLATRFTDPISLEEIAATLGVSVYHLCRVYRRVLGATLWSEIKQLRSREALVRLAEGESDLTALGLALGFSHHSHFTASFRQSVGLTPSHARRLLATGTLAEVRTLLAN